MINKLTSVRAYCRYMLSHQLTLHLPIKQIVLYCILLADFKDAVQRIIRSAWLGYWLPSAILPSRICTPTGPKGMRLRLCSTPPDLEAHSLSHCGPSRPKPLTVRTVLSPLQLASSTRTETPTDTESSQPIHWTWSFTLVYFLSTNKILLILFLVFTILHIYAVSTVLHHSKSSVCEDQHK